MKTFEDFRRDIMMRESSGDYAVVNTLGFLGAYQFGKPRLWDLGLSIDGWRPRGIKQVFPDIRVISKAEFLGDKVLQDVTFHSHVLLLATAIKKKFPEAVAKYSLSGLVAGAHLKGIGGVIDFLKGDNNKDAYGTEISEYIAKFANYDVFDMRQS